MTANDKAINDLLVSARVAAEELEYFIDFAVRQAEFEGDEDAARGTLNSLRIAAYCVSLFCKQEARAELEEADRQNSELLEAAVEGQSYWQARNARLTEALREIRDSYYVFSGHARETARAALDAQPEQEVGK